MNKVTIIFGIIVLICLSNAINAEQRRRGYLNSLDSERLLDLLLSAKRRGFLQNLEENEDENENQQARRHMINNMDDEDNEYERRFVRRKVVGLGDDPFRR